MLDRASETNRTMSRDQLEPLKNYLGQIHIIFKQYGLIDVLTDEGEHSPNFSQIGHLRPQYNKNGQVDYQEMDLLYITRETRFSIANTILLFQIGLAPFQMKQTEVGPIPEFLQTEVDTRFFYFVDDVWMRIYNFWNRIANFLNIFFQTERDPERVFFPGLIDKLTPLVESDPNFDSLVKFKEGDYKNIINRNRRKVVHRESSSATYFISFLHSSIKNIKKSSKLEKELSDLQKERDELPPFFVANYHRMIQGLDEMLVLIRDNVKEAERSSLSPGGEG